MQITIQVAPGLANNIAGPLAAAVAELGLKLKPMHPFSGDASLSRYYLVEVPDGPKAERIIERLRAVPGVEAAYIKPPDAMP